MQAFCVSERFQPPGEDLAQEGSSHVYLKIKDREAWILQSTDGEEEHCTKLPPPTDEVRFLS